MKRPELIALFRSRADDVAAPYLWSDLDAVAYLDDAHREAAIRARLIRDSSTPAIRALAYVSPIDALAAAQAAVAAAENDVANADLVVSPLGDGPSTAAMVAVVAAMAAVVAANTAAVNAGATAVLVTALVARVEALAVAAAALAGATTSLGDVNGIASATMVTAATVALTAAVATADTVAQARGDVGLSPLVLDLLRARIDGTPAMLEIKSVEQMDEDEPLWETRSYGTPSTLVTERAGEALVARLWPIPVVSGQLLLTVTRLPLSGLNTDDDSPEIPAQYHARLVDWMLRQAYLKKDSETLDAKASQEAESRFVASFGVFEDANVQRKQADRRTNQVQFREF